MQGKKCNGLPQSFGACMPCIYLSHNLASCIHTKMDTGVPGVVVPAICQTYQTGRCLEDSGRDVQAINPPHANTFPMPSHQRSRESRRTAGRGVDVPEWVGMISKQPIQHSCCRTVVCARCPDKPFPSNPPPSLLHLVASSILASVSLPFVLKRCQSGEYLGRMGEPMLPLLADGNGLPRRSFACFDSCLISFKLDKLRHQEEGETWRLINK
ncbi:hypothetical protein QBC45DRAFT_412611 [Copromyces sp. CBS 386.78]|nr:hypothetical protein QBC45DRAFT_412611 [Copromyces sp. CBS 386.78]